MLLGHWRTLPDQAFYCPFWEVRLTKVLQAAHHGGVATGQKTKPHLVRGGEEVH